MRLWLSVMALLGLLILWPAAAEAHRPVFVEPRQATLESPVEIGDPGISWAFYGRLPEPASREVYRLRAVAGEPLYFGVLVPEIERLRGFRPSVALVGPGLPADGVADLPIPAPPGSGAIVLRADGAAPRRFHEPFTQVDYWMYPDFRIPAPATGEYLLVVWSPSGQTGPYVIAVGEREELGAADVLRFPAAWVRARVHAERPVWYGVLAAVLVGGLIATALARLLRRLRRADWRERESGVRARRARRQPRGDWT
jgi:hypothetical protein